MDFLIAAELDGHPDESELRSLLAWLTEESPRPWRVKPANLEEPGGVMGGWSDTLQVALSAGGAGAVLAHSLSTWISTRRGRVLLRIRSPDGTEFVLDAELHDPDATVAHICRVAGEDGA